MLRFRCLNTIFALRMFRSSTSAKLYEHKMIVPSCMKEAIVLVLISWSVTFSRSRHWFSFVVFHYLWTNVPRVYAALKLRVFWAVIKTNIWSWKCHWACTDHVTQISVFFYTLKKSFEVNLYVCHSSIYTVSYQVLLAAAFLQRRCTWTDGRNRLWIKRGRFLLHFEMIFQKGSQCI